MAATTNISIRMDVDLKAQAEALFSELGMNLTTAFNIFVRQALRDGGIPFEISLNRPNDETLQAIDDVNNGRDLSPIYTDTKKLMEALNA